MWAQCKFVRFISCFLIQNEDVSECQGIKLDEKRSTSDCDGMRPAREGLDLDFDFLVYGIHGYMMLHGYIVHLDLQ